jgi:hypothetical protein
MIAKKRMTMRQGAASPAVHVGRGLQELRKVGQLVGLTRARADTGKDHYPVGVAERPDYLIESVVICTKTG